VLLPGRAALAYLSKAPADALPSAADELAEHFSVIVSKWDIANNADSDRAKRSAQQELMTVLKLFQRLGPHAKPAESALQDFRNRKLDNKDVRDAARDAWTSIKENN